MYTYKPATIQTVNKPFDMLKIKPKNLRCAIYVYVVYRQFLTKELNAGRYIEGVQYVWLTRSRDI